MSILVYFLFLAILAIIVCCDIKKSFAAFFIGTILFPNVSFFITNPSISPQHVILYVFLIAQAMKDPKWAQESFFRSPVKFPLIIIILSYVLTAFFNGGLLSKDMYYGIRDIIDTYGYLVAAYFVGIQIKSEEIASYLLKFVVICCVFGIIEGMLNANYPYKFINQAFPSYSGIYDLNSSVSLSQDWRIRTCFTTKHPTAFGTLLMSLFLFYLPLIKLPAISKSKFLLVLVLLGINIILCGSRTAMVCTLMGVILYAIDKATPILKIFIWGILLFSYSAIAAFMIAQFASKGSGSSIDFRTQQLIFSIMAIEESPVFGNGNKYASHNLFEEDERRNGAMRVRDDSGQDMGGLESVVFTTLIDRGFVGLFSYYFLFLWMLCIFYKNRNFHMMKNNSYVLLIAGALFLTLSGSIGNSSAFLYALLGLGLGNIENEKRLDIEKEEQEKYERLKQNKQREIKKIS